MRNKNPLILLTILILLGNTIAQDNSNRKTVTEKLPVNLDNSYILNESNVIPNSEQIILQDFPLNKIDYTINYRTKRFSLSDSLQYSLFDTIYISYSSIIVPIKNEYSHRKLEVRFDEKLQDSILIIRNDLAPLSSESIFGEGIKRSGSLSRGFSVGSNQDMKLNSGLRLQFSGKLSDDLEIVAALTDQNIPIQPEGTTERLEELDQVFIKVKHTNAAATFGDFQIESNIGEFGKIKRKTQGLEGEVFFGDTKGKGILAGSRGKFNTNQFLGSDGNQGPYRLSGINNEQLIIVIAGTERIYIDGEELKRGENNDYTIDYSLAEITFTIKRLITSVSRIVVDFEYTDREFERSLFGGNVSTTFWDNRVKLTVSAFNEGDDENNPIDITLSEEDKRILEQAGNDRNKAVKSGVTLAEKDSTGKRIGVYSLLDTLILGEKYAYLKYSPGEDSAKYNATFSFVGTALGDYNRISIGNYNFVGKGEGDYLPVVFIAMPQQKQIGNIVLEARPLENLIINAEFAGSNYDQNKLSEIDNNQNFGRAHNIKIVLEKSRFNIVGLSLGEVGFSYRERFVQDRFTTLDRLNSVEYNRDYNITDSKNANETLREAKLNLQPIETIIANINYGYLKRGDSFKSNRIFGDFNFLEKRNYMMHYNYDYVNTNQISLNSNWFKQNASASFTFRKITPGVEFLFEERGEKNSKSDSLTQRNFKFTEVGAFIQLAKLGGVDVIAKYSLRDESFPIYGKMEKQSRSDQQNLSLKYRDIKEANLSLELTLRNKKYTDKFKEIGLLDNNSVLIRSLNKFNFWNNFINGNIFYEASTQSTARLERVFVRVQFGEGNYRYLGDLNNNGIADEDEFVQDIYDGDYILLNVPTSELFPVINLKTSTRWKVNFSKILKSKKSLWAKILNPIFTETVLRLDEYSDEEEISKILLLNKSVLMNDSTTIRGANSFQQDLFFFKNKPDLSFRFRYLQNNKLNQYSNGNELGGFIERSLRVRFRMVKEIRNQTDFVNQTDNLSSETNSSRERMLSTSTLTSDFSYRPVQNIEVGFKVSSSKSIDNLPKSPTELNSNSQLIRFTYSFTNKGRLRLEAERSELTDNGTENQIPYEMLRGKVVGINYFWRVNFDYRLDDNLQITLNYLGRKQGANSIVHNMRTEARAYF